jgi:hypothetical protein
MDRRPGAGARRSRSAHGHGSGLGSQSGLALALALAPGGCRGAPPAPSRADVRPPVESADAIPGSAVRGTLRGRPFEARDARLLVDSRPGYEKVDLALSAASAEAPCGALGEPAPMRVWLRRKGAEPVAAGEIRLAPGAEQAWELHYQLEMGGEWTGSGEAAAIVRFRATDAGAGLKGELAACFADAEQSCVAGSFEALRCPISLDMPLRGNEPPEPMPVDAGEATSPGSLPTDAGESTSPGSVPADAGRARPPLPPAGKAKRKAGR